MGAPLKEREQYVGQNEKRLGLLPQHTVLLHLRCWISCLKELFSNSLFRTPENKQQERENKRGGVEYWLGTTLADIVLVIVFFLIINNTNGSLDRFSVKERYKFWFAYLVS